MLFYRPLSLLALQLSTTSAAALCSASDASTLKEALELRPDLPMVLAKFGNIAEACSKCAGPHLIGAGGFSDSLAGLEECLSPEDFARVVPPTAAPTAEATVAPTVLCKDNDEAVLLGFQNSCSGLAADGFCHQEQGGFPRMLQRSHAARKCHAPASRLIASISSSSGPRVYGHVW